MIKVLRREVRGNDEFIWVKGVDGMKRTEIAKMYKAKVKDVRKITRDTVSIVKTNNTRRRNT